MHLIETQHKRIPWRWVVLLVIMQQVRILALFASGSMTFTMRKYIESPLVINSVSSLDVLFNLLVAAPCLYYSDRIWTRFGRRLPFVLGGLGGLLSFALRRSLEESPEFSRMRAGASITSQFTPQAHR